VHRLAFDNLGDGVSFSCKYLNYNHKWRRLYDVGSAGQNLQSVSTSSLGQDRPRNATTAFLDFIKEGNKDRKLQLQWWKNLKKIIKDVRYPSAHIYQARLGTGRNVRNERVLIIEWSKGEGTVSRRPIKDSNLYNSESHIFLRQRPQLSLLTHHHICAAANMGNLF
jgi:hypothetical protein